VLKEILSIRCKATHLFKNKQYALGTLLVYFYKVSIYHHIIGQKKYKPLFIAKANNMNKATHAKRINNSPLLFSYIIIVME